MTQLPEPAPDRSLRPIVSPMWLVRNRGLVARDIRLFFAEGDHRHRLLFGFLALLIPAAILIGFAHDAKPEAEPPTMTYLPSWRADRSDAQIVAQQKIDTEAKAKADADRRESFRRLAKTLGIDG